MDIPRGRLIPDFIATCGGCGDHIVGLGSTAGAAREEAQRLGWGYTSALGWQCLRCLAKRPGK